MARILIVEDEAIVAMELQERLRGLGHDAPQVVHTGEDAVAIVHWSPPDLVLMDIRLAGPMDGIQAAHRIRKTVDVPIVYVTAHTDRGTLERAKQTEPVGYLPKPFDERSLRLTIELALHRHAAQRQRQEAEAARRRAEARYTAVLDSSSDAILGYDEEGYVVLANPASAEVFDMDRSALLGKSIDELLPGCRVAGGGRTNLEGRRSSGERFQAEVAISPVRDEAPLYTAVVRDVTEQRQLEEQLQHARRMEVVGRLAGGVAHDFNNVLSVILGYTQLIDNSLARGGTPARGDVRQIIDACQRASALTRDLLIFSRRRKPKTQTVDVSQIVSSLGPMLSRIIGEHVQLTIQAVPGQFACIDPGLLEQVVMNLAVNARDAMPQGGALFIAVRPDDGRVLLEVSDTGEGMSPATCARAFEPFFTLKGPEHGTGLGLANVSRIVEDAGGQVELQSELERGTSFFVWLPLVEASDVPGARASNPTAAPMGGTVLLVEDDEPLRVVAARVLTAAGYETLVARDAVEAARVLQLHQGPVDVLLTDVVLPGVGGPELARDLRQEHPNLSVLLMSGHRPEVVEKWGADGQPGVLMKPFTPDELLEAVATATRAPGKRGLG